MLYVVRHGETSWNYENKILGRTDIPLNDNGLRQAEEAGAKLSSIPLDAICTSPLSRAAMTAEAISKAQARPVPCFPMDCLMEQDFGIFEGENRKTAAFQNHKRMYIKRYPEGESFFDLAARVYPFLHDLQRDHAGQNVLVVTHGGICRMIHSFFYPMENEEFSSFSLQNCEIRTYPL